MAGPELSVCEDRGQEATEATVWGGEEQTGKKRAKEAGGDWVPQGLRGHGEEAAFDLKGTGEPPKVFSAEATRRDLKRYLGCYVETR